MSWLAPVSAALDAALEPCAFFFRDDDAGWADGRLFEVLDLFERHEVPVDVAVIPTEASFPLARSLSAHAARGGVHLHQHGYAHVNHEPVGRKHEFGPSRDVITQIADVVAGRQLLGDAFGDRLEPIFTPPWNRCSPATGAALVAAGVRVLSQDQTARRLERSSLREVPVTVDWFAHRRGVRLTAAELARRVAAQVDAGGPVGLMLHHQLTDEAEQGALAGLLRLVATHPMARATTMLELAE